MVINISKRFSMFTLITVFLLLYLIPFNTHAINISGTVYTDEGLTPMADGRTVRIKSNGAGNYTDLLDSGNGIYTIAAIPAQSNTLLTVFIDGAAEKGTTVMVTDGADINNLDIYQNHIIVRNCSGSSVDLFGMSRYDKDQDIDILFDADTAGAYTLVVDPGNEFYIWPDSYFFAAFLTGSSIIVEDIKILGTYSAVWTWPTTYVSGNWTNLGVFQNDWGMGAVIFDAGSGTKHITSSGASIFSDITFNDGGGGATWVLEDELVVKGFNTSSLTIISGTLDVNSSENNAINIEGNWTNTGTFLARNSTVTFDDDQANSRTITSGGTSFYNLVINPSAAATYILEDALDVANNLTITTGTLDTKTGENNSINLEGSFTNAATFLARNGTVTFDDDQANSRTITSGGTSFYTLVINPSAATTYALEEPLDVDHNLTLSGGTLDTKSGENNAISVAGNWTNSATFTAQNGTITFNGSASQNITTGSSNWYELTITNSSLAGVSFLDKFTCNSLICTTPDAHLNFKFKSVANEKFEITSAGGLHLEGADSQPIVLRRYLGAVGDHWDIYPSGDSWTVSYVDVQDSSNSYPLYINPSHSTDSGNNYNWFTQETCVVQPYPATSILGSGSLIYFSASNAGSCASDPSYLWNVASVIGSAINVDGIYASGNNDTGAPATDTVTVTDSANGIIGTASVCVGKVDCELPVSPSSKTVPSGEAIQLSATESAGCDLAASYSWKVESTIGSSVNASGLYTAGTNNTLSNISETVTITDSTNCAVATATITVKGIRVTTTTTIPITPTTTTSIPETTTTTVPVTPTTTTTPITCALAVNPQLATVNPSDTVTFTASELGECDSPDYEWAILTNTDSSLTPAGTTCIYQAGKNDGAEPFTDIITVTDSAHGNISANARVTTKASEPPPSIVVMPNLMLRSHLIALPVLMFIYGTNTHFHQVNPTITFNSSNSVFALPPLAIDDATIISLIFVMPSWFTGSEEETVTVTTITGSEVSSTTFDIEMLPLILEEERQ